jgi:hypothetical protein
MPAREMREPATFPDGEIGVTRSGRTAGQMPSRLSGHAQPSRAIMAGLLMLSMMSIPSMAQTSRLPPVIDAMTAPYSESELGGIGCLAGTLLAGGTVVALAGGGAVVTALQGPLTPLLILEGGAALAFLMSSACYVGQALTPVTMLGWASVTGLLPSPIAGR